jgi:hypothetical protein
MTQPPPGSDGSEQPQDPFAPPAGDQPPPYGQPPGYGQPPPAYGQPAYGQPPYAAPSTGTNGFAIASLVTAFLCSLLGLIFGLVALSQIKRTGQGGYGLAVAGIVISVIGMVVGVAVVAAG